MNTTRSESAQDPVVGDEAPTVRSGAIALLKGEVPAIGAKLLLSLHLLVCPIWLPQSLARESQVGRVRDCGSAFADGSGGPIKIVHELHLELMELDQKGCLAEAQAPS